MIKKRKSLGQYFLKSNYLLEKLSQYAELRNEDVVVEIGAGLGDLTAILAKKAMKVIAIELDNRLVELLEKRFREWENIEIIEGDALKFNYQKVSEDYKRKIKLIGNIPYYLSTDLTMHIFKMRSYLNLVLFMFQKEFAERIIAKPYSKNYGPLSIFSQVYADVSLVMLINRFNFNPVPKVDSALVKFKMYQEPKIDIVNEEFFEKMVFLFFNKRRKTIINALSIKNPEVKGKIIKLFKDSGIDIMKRAETLSIKELEKLLKNLWDRKDETHLWLY